MNIRDGAGVIERLLRRGKYRHVLEIGTYRGFTAAFMSQFCERVTTIDLKYGRMERYNDTFDRAALWANLGTDNIDLHLVENDDEKAALIAGLDFDFAFIDGDHDRPKADFELVKHCGAVLFHDYDGDNAVTRLVDALPHSEVEIRDIFALWTRHG